jgi:hypothetical protein
MEKRAVTKFKYFAYGSNMLTEWLRQRCPSAEPVGIAEAVNFSIEFSKLSGDKSGKATLIRSNRRSLGVVFEISDAELRALDEAEGNGYKRNDNFPSIW